MANELEVTIRAALNYNSGELKNQQFNFGTDQITQTNQLLYSSIISVPTSDTAVATGGVTASLQGYCGLVNLDGTNYVSFGPESAGAIVPAVKLLPGERHFFRWVPSAVYRWQSNTAICKVLIWLLGA